MLILSTVELKRVKDSEDTISSRIQDSKCFAGTSRKSLEDGRRVFCKYSRVFNVSHRTDKTLRPREKTWWGRERDYWAVHLVCTSIEKALLNQGFWTRPFLHGQRPCGIIKKPRHVTGLWGVFSGGLSTRLGEADWHLRWVFFYFIIQGRFLFGLEFEVWDCRSVLAIEFLHTPSYHILQVLLINSDAHISFYKSMLSFCWYQTWCWRNRKK